MKETRLMKRFSEKKFLGGKWAILDPKMVHPHNSGSAVIIVLKFCTKKGTNRWMKMMLTFFWKNFLGGKWTILSPKMLHPYNCGSVVRFF